MLPQQGAHGGIVLHHDFPVRVQSGYDHVVEVVRGAQGDNQRTPLFEVLLQVGPAAAKRKGAESVLPEVALHVGRKDSAGARRIELRLDPGHFGDRGARGQLRPPVEHHHGNAGGATAVLLLLHERHVQPDAGGRGRKPGGEKVQENARRAARHATA